MRILHVSDAYLPRTGGIELHIRDLAAAQRDMGDEVDILTLTHGDAQTAGAADPVTRPTCHGVLGQIVLIARSGRVIAAGDYDVVHAHCSTVSPLAFQVLRKPSVPTILTVHSLWRRYTAIYRTLDRCVGWSRWPISITAVSSVAASCVRDAASGPINIGVLPNGVNVAQWQLAIPRPEKPADSLRVLAVMRLAPRKRPLALLQILRATRDRLPTGTTLHATIVGDGRCRSLMQRYVDHYGLRDNVQLTGVLTRDRIAHLMVGSDVFIAPATLESFGIAAAEAHAAGVPVLGRTGTGLEQFLRRSGDGALVDSDNAMVERLVHAGRTGRLSPEPAPTMPDAGLRSLDWSSVVDVTREQYEKTIAGFLGR
jgi:phosphatidylinositol alpha 1,6-mannosyltransferase